MVLYINCANHAPGVKFGHAPGVDSLQRPTIGNQRTNVPVSAHLSLLHIPINMFKYYGI